LEAGQTQRRRVRGHVWGKKRKKHAKGDGEEERLLSIGGETREEKRPERGWSKRAPESMYAEKATQRALRKEKGADETCQEGLYKFPLQEKSNFLSHRKNKRCFESLATSTRGWCH